MITYRDEDHSYWDGDRRVISNTQVLDLAGLCPRYDLIEPWHREAALKIGKDVEHATLALDRRSPIAKIEEDYGHVMGYVKGWMAFKMEFKFRPLLREFTVHDPTLDVCTRLDAWGPCKFGEITVQIKTGQVAPFTEIQTAFEERAVWIHLNRKKAVKAMASSPNRWGVELRADGTYLPKQFNHEGYRNDIKVFCAAVTVSRWKLAQGIRI